jgi:hypothetical protein
MELTTGIRVDVAPSALAGAGGVALALSLHGGPLTRALTAVEAHELASLLAAVAER